MNANKYKVLARKQNPLTGSPRRDIPLLRHEGYGQRQSVAIAMEAQRTHENPRLTFHWVERKHSNRPTVWEYVHSSSDSPIATIKPSGYGFEAIDVTGHSQTFGSVVLAKQWIHNNLLERRKEHYHMGREGGRLGNPVVVVGHW